MKPRKVAEHVYAIPKRGVDFTARGPIIGRKNQETAFFMFKSQEAKGQARLRQMYSRAIFTDSAHSLRLAGLMRILPGNEFRSSSLTLQR